MRNNLLEALMGAIVLTIAGIFLIFAYTSSKTNTDGGYHLQASFNRIDGVNVGGDVKVSGVKVGTITKIDVDPHTYQATAKFSVRSGLLIPDDSSAEITSESLLGGKYVALVPGGSETYLQDGQSIENTQSSLSFEGLISKFLLSQGDSKKETEPAETKAAEPKVGKDADAKTAYVKPKEKALSADVKVAEASPSNDNTPPAEEEKTEEAPATAESTVTAPVAAITPVVVGEEDVYMPAEKNEGAEPVSATQ